ncbi:MAG: 3'-5' exonuclease, partial [Pseudomonadota bacterium]
ALSAILDVLDGGDLSPEQTTRFAGAMRDELRGLSTELDSVAARRERIASRHWPLRATSVRDIFGTLAARHRIAQVDAAEILADCDGFAVTTILDQVLADLIHGGTRDGVHLALVVHGAEVQITISWSGAAYPQAALEALVDAPLSPDYGDYTARDALAVHRTDIWIAEGQKLVLPLTLSAAGSDLVLPKRPDFYDFGLPTASGPNPALTDLTFVVFDTETTGLDPDRDEVVQLAGVRVLGGRLVQGEDFDRLVCPGRPIPVSATQIHGITDAMVAEASEFRVVAQDFAAFSEGAVLVAHNAPFDMAFLKRLDAHGLPFDHPVLCTARLSAALDGHQSDHTLDALAKRYGVEIEEALRHTALGDARATAEVFLKLLALLPSRDVTRLKEALVFQGTG